MKIIGFISDYFVKKRDIIISNLEMFKFEQYKYIKIAFPSDSNNLFEKNQTHELIILLYDHDYFHWSNSEYNAVILCNGSHKLV